MDCSHHSDTSQKHCCAWSTRPSRTHTHNNLNVTAVLRMIHHLHNIWSAMILRTCFHWWTGGKIRAECNATPPKLPIWHGSSGWVDLRTIKAEKRGSKREAWRTCLLKSVHKKTLKKFTGRQQQYQLLHADFFFPLLLPPLFRHSVYAPSLICLSLGGCLLGLDRTMAALKCCAVGGRLWGVNEWRGGSDISHFHSILRVGGSTQALATIQRIVSPI